MRKQRQRKSCGGLGCSRAGCGLGRNQICLFWGGWQTCHSHEHQYKVVIPMPEG